MVAREQADAVFEARVEAVQNADAGMVRYDLAVLRVFKGEVGPSAPLLTRASSAACGRSFVQGKRYLIYAHRTAEGDLGDTMCSRTRQIATADEDLAALGAGAPPPAPPAPEAESREPPRIDSGQAPPVLEAPAPATRGGCAVGDAGGPGGALLLALIRRRRRR